MIELKDAVPIFTRCNEGQRQTLCDMEKFTSSTLQASVFMGKNYSDNLHSIKNTEDLTIKQMFDISEKLITENFGISTTSWESSSW